MRRAAGVSIGERTDAGAASQKGVDRQAGDLALDVPEGEIDARHCGHLHRATTPIPAPGEVLPDVLDAIGITTDEERRDVLSQNGCDRQLASVEGCVTDTVDAGLVGLDLDDDVVASRTRHDDLDVPDLHATASRSIAHRCLGAHPSSLRASAVRTRPSVASSPRHGTPP